MEILIVIVLLIICVFIKPKKDEYIPKNNRSIPNDTDYKKAENLNPVSFEYPQIEEAKLMNSGSFNCPSVDRHGTVTIKYLPFDETTIKSLRKCFIAFDVETTGLNQNEDRIIEVSAVIFSEGQVIDSFSSLIKSDIMIPTDAINIHHITDEMLKTAPDEKEVYSALLEFLGEAVHGNIIMCAHNGKRFDFNFLASTLTRLGFDANIIYIDTLLLAQKYIHNTINYKQKTLEDYFNLTNASSHRASTDAENCGLILLRLLDLAEEYFENERKSKEKENLTLEELEVCAYIQNYIQEQGGDTSYLYYDKNSGGYVYGGCLNGFISFKISKNGRYILANANAVKDRPLNIDFCSNSESSPDYVRVYFSKPDDLYPLLPYIYEEFCRSYNSMQEYAQSSYGKLVEEIHLKNRHLKAEEVQDLLQSAKIKSYPPVDASIAAPEVSLDQVEIHAIHERIPLDKIKNRNSPEKGYQMGYHYWELGEQECRKGNAKNAIALFDIARSNGYIEPYLYRSYARTYRKMKDYSNEIAILDEGIEVAADDPSKYAFEARKKNAIAMRYQQQLQDQKRMEQEKIKKQRKEDKEQQKNQTPRSLGKCILQMDDDGNIINEFESINEAQRKLGINSKSIREAAKGNQKHAGGFCWKLKE